jgi:hypothetical protein
MPINKDKYFTDKYTKGGRFKGSSGHMSGKRFSEIIREVSADNKKYKNMRGIKQLDLFKKD